MDLSANFDYSKLDHTKTNTAHLVVALTAPEVDWVSKRPKICVLPVIDISGSMEGDKLHYAKSSVRKLVEQLTPGDVAGLLVFDDRTDVLVKPGLVTAEAKAKLLKAVDGIRPRGGTNLASALTCALKQIQSLDLPPSITQRVILFTDGQPTTGVTDRGAILDLLGKNRLGSSVSFFGYGATSGSLWGGCDQDFLLELSNIGKGNYAYVQNPDDALSAFGKELGGLLSMYASDLRLILKPKGGHRVSKVVSDVPFEEDSVDGEVILDLGDILAEETRHVILECELQQQNKAFPRPTTAFDVKATFMRLTSEGGQEGNTSEAKAQVTFVRPSDAQSEPDPKLRETVTHHKFVRAQMEAEALAKKSDFEGAQRKILDFIPHIPKDMIGLAGVAAASAHSFQSSANYATDMGYLKSIQLGVTRGTRLASSDSRAELALRSMDIGASNSAQDQWSATFEGTRRPSE